MHDRVEPCDGIRVAEHAAAERGAVERTVFAQHPVPEFGCDRGEHGRARPLDVADDLIGVDDHGAVLGEATGDRGLAGGDASGEGDEWHASRMPRAGTRGSVLFRLSASRKNFSQS